MAMNLTCMKANCAIDDEACRLIYDRISYPDVKKSGFSFEIVNVDGDHDRGEFKVTHKGKLIRHHESRLFPTGYLKVSGKPKVNDVSCIINLKKLTEEEFDLMEYFDN